MKRFLTICLISSLCLYAMAQQRTLQVSVSNPTSVAKTDAPVVIRFSEVKKLKFAVASASVKSNGTEIACQLDDLDADRKNDELAFVINLAANETKTFDVTLSAQANAKANTKARTYADMQLNDKKGKYPFITRLETPGSVNVYSDLYHHGAAFESELTAYRIYFDHRQNIDIYGKVKRQLELPDTHFYTTVEQQAQGYGNDVLWAGQSVGCGSLKLWDGSAPLNWTEVETRGQRIISAGPVRTLVEVSDLGVNGYDVRTLYTLWAGHREVEVCASLNKPIESTMFCTGVQKYGPQSESIIRESEGIAASWGKDYPEQSSDKAKEQFPPEAVGLAVYVPADYRINSAESDINCLFTIGKQGQTSFRYYVSFCADKEANGYHSASAWFNSLDAWKAELDAPVTIKVK